MNIPADTRQFDLKSVILVVTTIAVSLGIYPYLPLYGFVLPLGAGVFWIGMGILVISDLTDSGPIDERRPISKTLNLLGILTVILSLLACLSCLLFNGMYKWLT